MTDWHLAQLNIALLSAPIDSPQLATFVAELDRINALAEAAPGFVWRLAGDEGNALGIRTFGDEYIVNMSVWTDRERLFDYVYRSAHKDIMRRKRDWFTSMKSAHQVLWWVPAGHQPDPEEAAARLELLRREGPGPAAFTFKRFFDAPD